MRKKKVLAKKAVGKETLNVSKLVQIVLKLEKYFQ